MPDAMKDDRYRETKALWCPRCKAKTRHVYTTGGAQPVAECRRCHTVRARPTKG